MVSVMAEGELWALLRSLPRMPVARCRTDPSLVPFKQGVYVLFREGAPVYSGKAAGKRGLRGRLRMHLDTSPDLSWSSVRRNYAEATLGIPIELTRMHGYEVKADQVAAVNNFIDTCELAFHVVPSGSAAAAFEKALHSEWQPPLGKR